MVLSNELAHIKIRGEQTLLDSCQPHHRTIVIKNYIDQITCNPNQLIQQT